MIYRLNPQAAEPIFEQLARQVKDAVARGLLEVGAKLPSVRELARQVSVNPNTVIKAYDTLERDGVILRRQGAGCFVTGKTHNLGSRERQRQLAELLRHAVGEARHLGFCDDELRAAMDKELDKGGARERVAVRDRDDDQLSR